MALIPVVDRYVLHQVAKPLGTAMAIGLLVLLAERLVRILDITLGKKNSLGVVFELLAYLVPHYLGLALPAAMFLGLLFGFNKLSKDSEIDAFMASGVGLHRLALPIIILSIGLSAFSFLIFGWFQPHARYAYRNVMHTVKNVEVFYLAEEGVFMQAGTRTFILDKLVRENNSFERIFLFDNKAKGGAETVTAPSGSLISIPGEHRPVLRLHNGHRLKIAAWPDFNATGPVPKAVTGTYQTADTPLGKLSKKLFRPRGGDHREMTFAELIRALDNPPKQTTVNRVRSELHKRLVNVFTVLVLPFLALPFALGRRRGQRGYRFAVALIILVAFHEVISKGAEATKVHGTSPYMTMWLPLALLAVFSLWRFWNASFSLRRDWLEPVIERVSITLSGSGDFILRTLRISR